MCERSSAGDQTGAGRARRDPQTGRHTVKKKSRCAPVRLPRRYDATPAPLHCTTPHAPRPRNHAPDSPRQAHRWRHRRRHARRLGRRRRVHAVLDAQHALRCVRSRDPILSSVPPRTARAPRSAPRRRSPRGSPRRRRGANALALHLPSASLDGLASSTPGHETPPGPRRERTNPNERRERRLTRLA